MIDLTPAFDDASANRFISARACRSGQLWSVTLPATYAAPVAVMPSKSR